MPGSSISVLANFCTIRQPYGWRVFVFKFLSPIMSPFAMIKLMNATDITKIDPRLNDIDDCLYRVAARVLVVRDGKVLLVKEHDDDWWALPGGGIDHGESIEVALKREIEEELGVPAKEVSSNFQIVHYNIGSVVNGVPRMNLFFTVSVPEEFLKSTSHVAEWKWFTEAEFLNAGLHPSYSKEKLAVVIFAGRP